MSIQFPDDPIANPEYVYNGVTYKWDNDRWIVDSTGNSQAVPTLQQVTDSGDITTKQITADGFRLDQLSPLPSGE